MNRRDWHFARHLMHRRCQRCYQDGYQAGWLKHREQAERRDRLRREEGLPSDPALFESWLRRRAG